ncbi:MAG: response regulator [Candidatus Desulfatibia sp.]|jgi:CheY-like chemotaxis protein|uniref:response regulator n=1 Tax=Candidatus Desulfatibia sp. TaxID=3101189 RepID=UPI002F3312B6
MKLNNLKVLVVDDYQKMRQGLCATLKPLDLNISEASNGVEALKALRQDKFDVVFTDLVMPEMDGFELCEEIRKTPEWADMPIVVISTHYDSRYIVKALRQGADDYIPKPVEPETVKRVLDRILTPTILRENHEQNN